MMILDTTKMEIMIHALGLDNSRESYRNYYIASAGHHNYKNLEYLVSKGLMTKNPAPDCGKNAFNYQVTNDGIKICLIVQDLDREVING